MSETLDRSAMINQDLVPDIFELLRIIRPHPRGFPTIHLSKSNQFSLTYASKNPFEFCVVVVFPVVGPVRGGGILSSFSALSTACREKSFRHFFAVLIGPLHPPQMRRDEFYRSLPLLHLRHFSDRFFQATKNRGLERPRFLIRPNFSRES